MSIVVGTDNMPVPSGNARIDGMVEDLHLDSNKFNIALSVFYVPYILWDVPSNLVIKHLKAGYYLPGKSSRTGRPRHLLTL